MAKNITWLRLAAIVGGSLLFAQVAGAQSVVDPLATYYPGLYPEPRVLGEMSGHQLGEAGAPVTLEHWTTYGEPFAPRLEASVAKLLGEFSGKVHIVTKPYALLNIGTNSRQAEAAECAALTSEDLYWQFQAALLKANATQLTNDEINALAKQVYATQKGGTDFSAWESCFTSRKTKDVVSSYTSEGASKLVFGDPVVFVVNNATGARELFLGGPTDPEPSVRAAIKTILEPGTSSIEVSSPVTGVTWRVGETYTIAWKTTDPSMKPGIDKVTIGTSTTGTPSTFCLIADNVPDAGTYTWIVPASFNCLGAQNVRINRVGNQTLMGESGMFTIASSSPTGMCEHAAPPSGCSWQGTDTYPACEAKLVCAFASGVTVTSPAAGEAWSIGQKYEIKWQTSNPTMKPMVGQVQITLQPTSPACTEGVSACLPSAVSPYIISKSTSDTGSFTWAIPSTLPSVYQTKSKIVITRTDIPSLTGSSSEFSIGIAPVTLFRIDDVRGIGASYPAGGSITFSFRGAEPDGTSATPEEGFVSAVGVYREQIGLTYGNSSYNAQSSRWEGSVTTPSQEGRYQVRLTLYCPSDTSTCASRYGHGGPQVDKLIDISVSGSTITPTWGTPVTNDIYVEQQPIIVPTQGGLMALYSSGAGNRTLGVYSSFSSDRGVTWQPQRRTIDVAAGLGGAMVDNNVNPVLLVDENGNSGAALVTYTLVNGVWGNRRLVSVPDNQLAWGESIVNFGIGLPYMVSYRKQVDINGMDKVYTTRSTDLVNWEPPTPIVGIPDSYNQMYSTIYPGLVDGSYYMAVLGVSNSSAKIFIASSSFTPGTNASWSVVHQVDLPSTAIGGARPFFGNQVGVPTLMYNTPYQLYYVTFNGVGWENPTQVLAQTSELQDPSFISLVDGNVRKFGLIFSDEANSRRDVFYKEVPLNQSLATGTLIVKKHVVNKNGGTKTATDFGLNITAAGGFSTIFPGNETGTTFTVPVGDYTVSENHPVGYSTWTLTPECFGPLAEGQTRTCVVTNYDDSPTVKPAATSTEIKNDVTQVVQGKSQQVSGIDDVKAQEALNNAEVIINKIKSLQVEPGSPTPSLALVKDFVAFGTPTTSLLGAGERAGVIASFAEAFGKVPATDAEWEDVIKIANGRFPTQRSNTKEQIAEVTFKQIYKRAPNRAESKYDDAAVTVMTYGLRPATRNLGSEAAAIKSFKVTFDRAPSSAADWDSVRAIAYSGASREIKKTTTAPDTDHDGLSDADEAKYGTDPNNPDTDGDGFSDGTEVLNGFNPLGPGKISSSEPAAPGALSEPASKPVSEVPTGSLAVTIAPTPINPPAGLHTAGVAKETIAAFKFQATGESFTVKQLTLQPYVMGAVSDASNDRVASLRLDYPTLSTKPTALPDITLKGTAVKVDLSSNPLYVPQDSSAVLKVIVDWAPFTLLNGTEDENIAFGLDADNSLGGNVAVGSQSGSTLNVWGTNDPVGNRQNVYRTVLAVAAGVGTPNNTHRVRSAAQKVASWNFSADPSSSAFFRASDSITVHVSGNLSTSPVTFYLKDSSGMVRAQGTSNANSSSRDVVLTPVGSDIEISQAATLALDLETNTSILMAPDTASDEMLSVLVNTGTPLTAGDFRWYDNSDSAGGNDMLALSVVNPTSTTTTFVNLY